MSNETCHKSQITLHIFLKQSWGASWWRVCFIRGVPRLFINTTSCGKNANLEINGYYFHKFYEASYGGKLKVMQFYKIAFVLSRPFVIPSIARFQTLTLLQEMAATCCGDGANLTGIDLEFVAKQKIYQKEKCLCY